MSTFILKRFSATRILNTGFTGFRRGRSYDQDINRLGRFMSKRQIGSESLNGELRKLNKELNEANRGWQHIE